MLKLGFWGLIRGLWTFPRVLEPAPFKEWSFGGPKLKLWTLGNEPTYAGFVHVYTCLTHVYACFLKTNNFDCIVSPNSNSYNSLNINPNNAKFMFKLKPKISNFQWNKSHSQIICESKVMIKTVSKGHFSTSFSKRFEHFWVVITFKLLWTL